MDMSNMTVEQAAEEYTNALVNCPNGWGQNRHPVSGLMSHQIMWLMVRKYGNAETMNAIETSIKKRGI